MGGFNREKGCYVSGAFLMQCFFQAILHFHADEHKHIHVSIIPRRNSYKISGADTGGGWRGEGNRVLPPPS